MSLNKPSGTELRGSTSYVLHLGTSQETFCRRWKDNQLLKSFHIGWMVALFANPIFFILHSG